MTSSASRPLGAKRVGEALDAALVREDAVGDVGVIGDGHRDLPLFGAGGIAGVESVSGRRSSVGAFVADQGDEGFEREQVAAPAEAADLAAADRREQRGVAERLAGVDIGEMDLDGGVAGSGEGVAQGDTGVGQSARVDDDARGVRRLGLEEVDQRALGVGLEWRNLAAKLGGARGQALVDLGEGRRAVDRRLARAQHVEVGAVDRQDAQSRGLRRFAHGCRTADSLRCQ